MRYDNPDFVDTSEAYASSILIAKEAIIVPYIGLSLMSGNPIAKENSFVDFSYFVFTSVASIKIDSSIGKFEMTFNNVIGEFPVEYIAVDGRGVSGNWAHLDIASKSSYLVIPDTSVIRSAPFKPVDTPNNKANMDADAITVFLNYVPSEVKTLIGEKYFKLLL